MNDTLVECFRAATETLNFTTAAQQVHISQPSFSRNIATLEEEVGFRLFLRSKQNGVRLTSAGLALYNGLSALQKQYSDLLEKAKRISRGEEGRLVIGILNGICMDSKTFYHIKTFRERYPRVEVELHSYPLAGLEDGLLKGSCDVIFVMANVLRNRDTILYEKVYSAPSFFAVPKSLHLDPEQVHSISDLRDQTFILSEDFQRINENMALLCRGCGFEPRLVVAPDYETAILWADMGLGVTGVTRDHYIRNSPAVDLISLRELIDMDFSLAWNKENYNPAIALFYSLIDEVSSVDEEVRQ